MSWTSATEDRHGEAPAFEPENCDVGDDCCERDDDREERPAQDLAARSSPRPCLMPIGRARRACVLEAALEERSARLVLSDSLHAKGAVKPSPRFRPRCPGRPRSRPARAPRPPGRAPSSDRGRLRRLERDLGPPSKSIPKVEALDAERDEPDHEHERREPEPAVPKPDEVDALEAPALEHLVVVVRLAVGGQLDLRADLLARRPGVEEGVDDPADDDDAHDDPRDRRRREREHYRSPPARGEAPGAERRRAAQAVHGVAGVNHLTRASDRAPARERQRTACVAGERCH